MPATRKYARDRSNCPLWISADTDDAALALPMPVVSWQTSLALQWTLG